MRKEEVIRILKQESFNVKPFADLEDSNMEYWYNNNRVIVIKEYKTESSFLRWLDDQSVLAEIYKTLPTKLKNNLYFLMIVNFVPNSPEIKMEINTAQKNRYVCKKNVLKELNDLNRIPFLNQIHLEIDTFDYDNKFREQLSKENKISDNTENILSYQEVESSEFIENTSILLDYYFSKYINNKCDINNLIDEILEYEGNYDYK